MQRQYGSRLYKCNRLGCPFFRIGFEAMSERDRHLRKHDRPYKCDRPSCDFSHMGLGSQARLHVHLQYHEKQGKSSKAHLAETDNNEDVENIVLDAVRTNDLDLIRDFVADIPSFDEKVLRQAVKSSSGKMLELLLNACNFKGDLKFSLLADAVRDDNLETARVLLDRGASVYRWDVGEPRCMYDAIQNRSSEMITLLLPYYPELVVSMSPHELDKMIPAHAETSHEAKCIQCLSLLRDSLLYGAFEHCFRVNAQKACSIAIAEYLLRNGVDINTSYGGKEGSTALFWASGKKTQRAAELMKFLLEFGANPHLKLKKNPLLGDRPGPRNISKWLGISWEQLVEESHEKHVASLKMKPQ